MALLTFSKFGRYGRLGNQLFQYASLIGFSEKYGAELQLPKWQYAKFFDSDFPELTKNVKTQTIKESAYHFTPEFYDRLNWNQDVDLLGYFQSEKYFSHCEKEVRQKLIFKKDFAEQVRKPYERVFEKPVIAIHVRRGDYVDNANYVNLPAIYYILSLYKHFPDWQNRNLLFFSDDPAWCKIHFACLETAFFAEGNKDIEDLCLMSQCNDFILANSSFGWWAAWLGEKKRSKVIYPAQHFDGPLSEQSTKDLYPERWTKFDHSSERIPLKDVTFTIPVAYDHKDRKQNLELIVCLLQKTFDTNIVIGEQGGNVFEYMSQWCEYRRFDMKVFHRTKMLNDMAKEAKTKFVANYDCDVTLPPMQILQAVEKLRDGADITSPYDGGFAGVPRNPWFPLLEKYLDVGIFGNTKFRGKGINPNSGDAYGGAIFVNLESYIAAGMENENYISWSAEDSERWLRFTKLGLRIERVGGFIYHIDHWRGPDSSRQNPYWQAGEKESEKIRSLDKEGLQEYIKTWIWVRH